MKNLFFDSNVWDSVLEDQELQELLLGAFENNQLRIFASHVQSDEQAHMHTEKLRMIESLRYKFKELKLPTAGFVLGVSKVNEATLSSEQFIKGFNAFLEGVNREKNIADALIATTGAMNDCLLVTNDKKMRRRAEKIGFTCCSTIDLHNLLKLD